MLLLKVSGLRKTFGGFAAVDGVTFKVEKGSTVLLLGPNGAGKTTIIKCVTGLLNFIGSIEVDGFDARGQREVANSRIGYLPQNLSFYENLTLLKEAGFIAGIKGVSQDEIREKLEIVDLWRFRERKVKSLSSGMRQRLAIALALFKDPPLLIFDEPVSNVDMQGQIEFQSLLDRFRKLGKTSLITTHTLGLDKYAQDVIVMDRGKIVAEGNPSDLLGKIHATDKVFIKVATQDLQRAMKVLDGDGTKGVMAKGDWLVFTVVSSAKAAAMASLVENGIAVEDVIVESATIESEYVGFLRDVQV